MKKDRKRIWEIKQSTTPGILELYIYGYVEPDGYDWWSDEIIESETSANHFRSELGKHPDISQINIYINSYGGSVFEGTAIYNQLKRHPAQKTVYVDGFACSVASVIAMAGDKVVMPRNTMMMIHDAWDVVAGNSRELRKAAEDLEVIMEANRQAYLMKTGDKLTEEALINMMAEETWLTAAQCLEYGLADEYAEKDADLTQAKDMLQRANLSIAQQIEVNKSLAAQLRQLIDEAPTSTPAEPAENDPVPPADPPADPEPPETDPVPPTDPPADPEPPETDPVPGTEQKLLKFITALGR